MRGPSKIKTTSTLGLQVPPQKVFGPFKPTPNTFLEGTWSPRVYVPFFLRRLLTMDRLWGGRPGCASVVMQETSDAVMPAFEGKNYIAQK